MQHTELEQVPEPLLLEGKLLRVVLAAPEADELVRVDGTTEDKLCDSVRTVNAITQQVKCEQLSDVTSLRELFDKVLPVFSAVKPSELSSSVFAHSVLTVTASHLDEYQLGTVTGFELNQPIKVEFCEVDSGGAKLYTDHIKLTFFVKPEALRDAIVSKTADLFASLVTAAQEQGFTLTTSDFSHLAGLSTREMKSAIGKTKLPAGLSCVHVKAVQTAILEHLASEAKQLRAALVGAPPHLDNLDGTTADGGDGVTPRTAKRPRKHRAKPSHAIKARVLEHVAEWIRAKGTPRRKELEKEVVSTSSVS